MSHVRRSRFENAPREWQAYSPLVNTNRRINARYIPAEDRAWLGWWEGQAFRTTEAVLLNISKGGVLIQVETPPPRRATVWICLDGPRRTEWVEGRALDVSKAAGPGSAHEVRVMFDEICPYGFFEVALFGWDAAIPEPIVSLPDTNQATSPGLAMMHW